MLTGWEGGGRRVDPGVGGVHRKGTCEQGVLEEKKTSVWLCGLGWCWLMCHRNANRRVSPLGDWRNHLPGLFKALQLVCGERAVVRVGQIFKIMGSKHVDFWR